MTSILGQRAAQYAAAMCDDYNVGYSQHNRWDMPDISELISNTGYGGAYEADCSSLTARAYNAAIVSLGLQGRIPLFPESDATWTGSWRSLAAARGFSVEEWYPGVDLDVGDLLLSERDSGGTGHIAMYTGGDAEREAWISEIGDIYGASGDQTGEETRTKPLSEHPLTVSGQWTHVLHAPSTPTTTTTSTPTTTQESDDMFESADRAKLDGVSYLLSNNLGAAIGRLDQERYVARNERAQITASLAALTAAVKTLATAKGADPDAILATIKTSVDAGVARALEGLEITLAAKETAK